ncbi:unnamed protein product [Gulo gulo]|uniref:Uncharacterized protein n=1 Tax=Gulo gulo TaxID=48420 RepID=A0A9X9LZV8_GULGU|nr:unnamed protein product [Gulo gulo]
MEGQTQPGSQKLVGSCAKTPIQVSFPALPWDVPLCETVPNAKQGTWGPTQFTSSPQTCSPTRSDNTEPSCCISSVLCTCSMPWP